MTDALEAMAGRCGWIISDGKTGNDVQTRGVFDALGLDYTVKHVAPTGLWQILSPWGPVNPSERFGTRQSQFRPPMAGICHCHWKADDPLHPQAQAACRFGHLHNHPAKSESAGQDC